MKKMMLALGCLSLGLAGCSYLGGDDQDQSGDDTLLVESTDSNLTAPGLYDKPAGKIALTGNILHWESLPVGAIEWYENGIERTPVAIDIKGVPLRTKRFTFVMRDGSYLQLACSGKNQLELSGVHIDCSAKDQSGKPVGALMADTAK